MAISRPSPRSEASRIGAGRDPIQASLDVGGDGAGAVVGYYFNHVFAIDHADSAGVLLTFIGAFVAGRIAADIVAPFVPRLAA